MELVNWSLSAIDYLFSTWNSGVEDPTCPNGTFSVGYNLDYYKDIYIIGRDSWHAAIGNRHGPIGKPTGRERLKVPPGFPSSMVMDLNKAVASVGMGMNELKECKLAILKPTQPIIESWKSLWKG